MNRRPSSSAYQNLLSIISNIRSETFKASEKNVTFRDPDFLAVNEIHHHYKFIKSGKFSLIFHKVSRFKTSSSTSRVSLKGKFTPCFPPRTFVASAVANRTTRHLSDLQIHNGLPCTVLEANFVIVWYVLRVSSQACQLVASTQQFIIHSLTECRSRMA